MSKSQKPKSNHPAGLFGLIFLLAFIASCPLSWRFAEARYLVNREGTNPEWFPVLVITPDNAEIIRLGEIGAFARTNPNYSFLVPEGKEDFYRDKLRNLFMQRGSDGSPNFEVRRISPERQAIKWSIVGDGLVGDAI